MELRLGGATKDPATADGGGSLLASGLGGDHLGWAVIFGGRPSLRWLVGLGHRTNMFLFPSFGPNFSAYLRADIQLNKNLLKF